MATDIADCRMSHARVDLRAITANARALKAYIPETTHLAVAVKADGYGHGAVAVARAALAGGASRLLVATVREGATLRAAGLGVPILVLGPTAPEEAGGLVAHNLTPHVCDLAMVDAVAAVATRAGCTPYPVHVKVDTGMHRFGVDAADAVAFVSALHARPGIFVEGVATHFATADVPGDPFLYVQAERFTAVVAALEGRGMRPPLVHAANSGATLQRVALWDMVRVGIALYGIPPDIDFPMPLTLAPALTVQSRVARVFVVPPNESVGYGRSFVASRPTRAALVPLGYADGLPRALSNAGALLIGGRRCPLIGRVSMDQCVVAVPDDLRVAVGDDVVIVGQSGEVAQTITELAQAAGTIGYEVAVRFGARLRRAYLHDDDHENRPIDV